MPRSRRSVDHQRQRAIPLTDESSTMTKITWLSHGSWMIENDDHRLLIDPFLTDNPAAKTTADELHGIGHILISHGHFDHVADAAAIAKCQDATIVAIYEIAEWFATTHDVPSTIA